MLSVRATTRARVGDDTRAAARPRPACRLSVGTAVRLLVIERSLTLIALTVGAVVVDTLMLLPVCLPTVGTVVVLADSDRATDLVTAGLEAAAAESTLATDLRSEATEATPGAKTLPTLRPTEGDAVTPADSGRPTDLITAGAAAALTDSARDTDFTTAGPADTAAASIFAAARVSDADMVTLGARILPTLRLRVGAVVIPVASG